MDHVNIHAAFLISSATSIALVVSYLRLVGGLRFAFLQAGVAQLVFLVWRDIPASPSPSDRS